MKNILFSTEYKNSINLGLLVLRVGFGLLMIPHGWGKLMRFEELEIKFMNFMGLGSTISLGLVIFSELLCSVLLIFGLLTRWATIPLIVTAIVISSAHQWDFFGESELGSAYLFAYIAILFLGPGKLSLDHLFSKKRKKSFF
nr:DoxX family protein [uncultured Flavobacterium sp.]